MTLLVPFDGSELAEEAVRRATEFGREFDRDVLAVTIVPFRNAAYARDRGWLADDEAYETETVVSNLRRRATYNCPGVEFRHEVVDRSATPDEIADRLRAVAIRERASVVFVGSENAGRVVTSMSSVGETASADETYDVVIVRQQRPRVAQLPNESDHRTPQMDFYLPD